MDTSRAQSPTRAILLGASNLTYGFPLVVHALRSHFAGPLDVYAALGHGRSFGIWSRVLIRELPGITESGLWTALREPSSPPTRTVALITDVGNDLIYGVPPATIARWVETCLENLRDAGAQIVITLLPMASVRKLSNFRFEATRRLFFASHRVTLAGILEQATTLNDRLRDLAAEFSAHVVDPPSEWYGFDPIHLRMSRAKQAWHTILTGWPDFATAKPLRRPAWSTSWSIRTQRPADRRWLGKPQFHAQPGVVSNDLRLWLY